MAVIYSSDLKLSIISTGTEAGVWGQITNTNLYLLQQAIGGYQAISIAGGAQTTTLTMSDGAISNARNAVIKLTGTITGNQVVTIPTGIEKTYIVSNGTTGAFTVEFKTASGTGTTFSTTDKGIKILFADGTNIVDVNSNFSASSFPQINDSNGNEEIIFTTTASAVNELTIANAATGNAPSIATSGSDTNISLTIAPKGTGDVNVDADTLRVGDSNADATITTNGTGDLTLSTNAGSNSGTIKIFDAANGNIEITPNGTGVVKLDGLSYPTADGSANQALVTNGSGVLSFAAVGGGTPYFSAKGTGTPTPASATTTKAQYATELFDSGGCYDTSLYRFTPNSAGYYHLGANTLAYKATNDLTYTQIGIFKNGTGGTKIAEASLQRYDNSAAFAYAMEPFTSGFGYANGTTDYFEVYISPNQVGGGNVNIDAANTFFFGYRVA